jgi:hypothetical protein
VAFVWIDTKLVLYCASTLSLSAGRLVDTCCRVKWVARGWTYLAGMLVPEPNDSLQAQLTSLSGRLHSCIFHLTAL